MFWKKFFALALAVLLLVPASLAATIEENRWIIKFKEKPGIAEKAMLRLLGVKFIREYKNFPIATVELPEITKGLIEKLPFVEYVEKNIKVRALSEVQWNVLMVYNNAPN